MFAFRLRSHKKRGKQLKSQIKVIKRNREIIPTDRPAPRESKSVEQNAREITIVIKNWIAESRQRKRSLEQFSSLFTLPTQVKSTN
jgi:c-di-GMP-binding flagellar brake protein YcgR